MLQNSKVFAFVCYPYLVIKAIAYQNIVNSAKQDPGKKVWAEELLAIKVTCYAKLTGIYRVGKYAGKRIHHFWDLTSESLPGFETEMSLKCYGVNPRQYGFKTHQGKILQVKLIIWKKTQYWP